DGGKRQVERQATSWACLSSLRPWGGPHPGRIESGDTGEHRAAGSMRARQIADAHQELAHDLAAGEAEGVLEQLDPARLVARVMGREPAGEAAEFAPQGLDAPGIVDRRIDLQAVADDRGV